MDVVHRLRTREDFHQSTSYAKIMEDIGWSSIPVSGGRISVRSLGPISIAKMQRAKVIDLTALKKLQTRLKIISVILEPAIEGVFIVGAKTIPFSFATKEGEESARAILRSHWFHKSGQHYAHSKTALIDLSESMDSVLKTFSQTTRAHIKKAQNHDVSYITTRFAELTSENIQDFIVLHDEWSKERKIFGFSNSFLDTVMRCFTQNGYLISAYHQNVLVGAMMVLIHDRIGYYFYTCTSKQGRDLHVPSGLAFEALSVSKKNGCDIFDFCSVYDERFPKRNPRWKGFTTYKYRFNPVSVYYPPTFVRGIF